MKIYVVVGHSYDARAEPIVWNVVAFTGKDRAVLRRSLCEAEFRNFARYDDPDPYKFIGKHPKRWDICFPDDCEIDAPCSYSLEELELKEANG